MKTYVTQFVKVLLVKLSDMLDLSNFIKLFHRQSFALYGSSMHYFVVLVIRLYIYNGVPVNHDEANPVA